MKIKVRKRGDNEDNAYAYSASSFLYVCIFAASIL